MEKLSRHSMICPPLLKLAIFSVLLSICCGPAYNQNSIRAIWRSGQFFVDSDNQEALISYSLKIFQTCDLIAGAVVGILLGLIGPRLTHSLGYIMYCSGLLLSLQSKTVWWGMVLQGISLQTLLNSVLSLANLFNTGSKLAVSLLSGSSDLATSIYPLGLILINYGFTTPRTFILQLAFISLMGCGISLCLLPDSPYIPVNEHAKQLIVSQLSNELDDVESDPRDHWDSSSSCSIPTNREHDPFANNISTNVLVPTEPHEKRSLLSVDDTYQRIEAAVARRTDSALSLSMIGLLETHGEKESLILSSASAIQSRSYLIRRERRLSQLKLPECCLMTIFFTFSLIRMNLYLDGNEQILKNMSDSDEGMAQEFARYLPFGFVACLLNGVLMEIIGIIPTAMYLNTLGIAVNLLSMIDWLSIQRLTFTLFIFSKASIFSVLFAYLLDNIGLRYFNTLVGIISVFGGVMNEIAGSIVIQYVLNSPNHDWFWINGILAGGGFLLYIPVLLLWYRSTVNEL